MDRPEEDELTQAVIALAMQYGRYGYRRIAALLRGAGWPVGKDRGFSLLKAFLRPLLLSWQLGCLRGTRKTSGFGKQNYGG